MNDLDWIRESNLIEEIDDPQEDRRSLEAWEDLQPRHLTEKTILDLHAHIMCNLRPDIAGRYRVCNVCVGAYVAPPWREVQHCMRMWMAMWPMGIPLTEEAIRRSHVEFERIHPFEDGNGRVGRMLMNWLRVSRGMEPLLIKASEREVYYRWFR